MDIFKDEDFSHGLWDREDYVIRIRVKDPVDAKEKIEIIKKGIDWYYHGWCEGSVNYFKSQSDKYDKLKEELDKLCKNSLSGFLLPSQIKRLIDNN